MQVGEILHEVGPQSVPAVFGEETHVIEVYTVAAFQEDAQESFLHSAVGGERCGGLLPLAGLDGDGLFVDGHVLVVHQFDAYPCLLALQIVQTGIDREVVFHAFLQAHAEEAAVFQPGELLVVAGRLEHHVVRVAVESRLHVTHGDVAKSAPTHEFVGKFKAPVLHQLGIKTAVGAKVDVLEEDAVHGGLDGAAGLGVDRELARLC